MCTRGKVCVRSPLPSLVTMIDVPVSATRKFAPVMPTSAARKRSRRITRASVSSVWCSSRLRSAGRCVCTRRKSASICSLVRCTAGMMMCEGSSWRICTRYSPRSVSTGAMPLLLEEVVDRDLLADHRLALGDELRIRLAADVEHQRARFLGGHRVVHVAAGRGAALLELLQIEIEMRQRVVLDVARGIAQRLEFRKLAPPRRGAGPRCRSRCRAAPTAVAGRPARPWRSP